jgi:hypothetical protein
MISITKSPYPLQLRLRNLNDFLGPPLASLYSYARLQIEKIECVEMGEQTLILNSNYVLMLRVTSRLVSLDPSLNVMNKTTSNSVNDVLLNEKPRILVRIHLFQIQTISQRYFISLPKLRLQSLIPNIRLLPLAVLSHCLVSEAWDGEADVATRAYVSCWRWFRGNAHWGLM